MANTPAVPGKTSEIGRNPAVETLLLRAGIPYEFVPNFKVEDIVLNEGVQVRLGVHRAPKTTVIEYAAQMKAGVPFPGVVLTERYELVDGNTRKAACEQNGTVFFPAYILSGQSDSTYKLLALEINQQNGKRMEKAEIRSHVEEMSKAGSIIDPETLSRSTGASPREIRKWVRLTGFQTRAADAGIDTAVLDALNESVRLQLDRITSAPVLRQATEVASRAALTVTEAKELVSDIVDSSTKGEVEALETIGDARTSFAERMTAVSLGVGSRPSPMGRHKMHLSYLQKNLSAHDLDTVFDAEEKAAYIVQVEAVRALLDDLLRTAGVTGTVTAAA